jgi:hypothetical protein
MAVSTPRTKRSPDHRTHAAAHEIELEAGHHHADVVNGAAHDHQCVGLAGVVHGLLEAFRVLAAVLELQRVDRQHFLAHFEAAFVVQEQVESRTRTDAVVVAAGGADVLVLLQIGLVEHRFATGALDPQSFRHRAAVSRIGVLDLRRQ